MLLTERFSSLNSLFTTPSFLNISGTNDSDLSLDVFLNSSEVFLFFSNDLETSTAN